MELISWRWRWKWWSWSECTHWHTANSRAKEKKVKANKTLRPSLFIDPTTLELICLFAINWSQLAMTLLPFTHSAQWKKKKSAFCKKCYWQRKKPDKALGQANKCIHSFLCPSLTGSVLCCCFTGQKIDEKFPGYLLFVCLLVCLPCETTDELMKGHNRSDIYLLWRLQVDLPFHLPPQSSSFLECFKTVLLKK